MKKKILLIFVIMSLTVTMNAYSQDEVSDAIERRLEISGRLDSIELEKQKMKRSGKSIKELDELSAALRDSIELLRENMPIISEADASKDINILKPGPSFLKSKSLFDWLIIGAGAAALISGVVLIFGIISSIKKGKKGSKQSSTLSQKMSSNRNGLMDIPITKEKPLNLPKDQPKQDTESINRLREKIHSTQKTPSASPFDRPVNVAPTMPPSNTPSATASGPAIQQGAASTNNLKSQIVNAARNGMSEADIAKHFKVSIDQVSLVLKMSDGSMRGV